MKPENDPLTTLTGAYWLLNDKGMRIDSAAASFQDYISALDQANHSDRTALQRIYDSSGGNAERLKQPKVERRVTQAYLDLSQELTMGPAEVAQLVSTSTVLDSNW